jgi:predicted anti-sigma-YlaC factor YlaD
VICEEVHDRLPDHALGTLEEIEDVRIRRHLRGCAQCRRELAAIGEGLTMFAAAAHDRPPPEDLRDRVLGVLAEEWRQQPVRIPDGRPPRRGWLVATAAATVAVLALTWGIAANGRAGSAAEDAVSYRRLLGTLGGQEFRVGRLEAAGTARIQGSVALYDSSVEQSWGVVLVRAPELTGSVNATLASESGDTMALHPIELDAGSGATWLVTSEDIRAYDRLTLRSADGTVLATAAISPA